MCAGLHGRRTPTVAADYGVRSGRTARRGLDPGVPGRTDNLRFCVRDIAVRTLASDLLARDSQVSSFGDGVNAAAVRGSRECDGGSVDSAPTSVLGADGRQGERGSGSVPPVACADRVCRARSSMRALSSHAKRHRHRRPTTAARRSADEPRVAMSAAAISRCRRFRCISGSDIRRSRPSLSSRQNASTYCLCQCSTLKWSGQLLCRLPLKWSGQLLLRTLIKIRSTDSRAHSAPRHGMLVALHGVAVVALFVLTAVSESAAGLLSPT